MTTGVRWFISWFLFLFPYWKSDAGRDWGQEEKETTEDEMAGWHHWLNGRESEWTPGDGMDREAWCATIHGVAKSRTWLSDWTELNWLISYVKHLIMYLLSICIPSFEKYLFSSVPIFKSGYYYYYLLSCGSSLQIFKINPIFIQIYGLQIFSSFCRLPFHSINYFLCCIEIF